MYYLGCTSTHPYMALKFKDTLLSQFNLLKFKSLSLFKGITISTDGKEMSYS